MDSNGFFGGGDVELAGNGRYLLDVDGQGQKSYTRATTIAKTLESTFHLDLWKQKNAAKGVASRPDLVARAVVTPVSDKPAWKEILDQAEIVAAGGAKANLGTAFHALHDNVSTMSDEEYAAVPADIRDLYEKYRAELARLGIVEIISEVTVCAEQIGTAGKADGFVRMPDGSVRVLDRKSGRVTEYPHAPACQLAIYVNANKILMPSDDAFLGGWMDMTEVFPTLDRETGLIVDVTYATETTPSSVHIYEIDLMAGWYGALLACKVRRWRNRKDLLTPYQPEEKPAPTNTRKVAFTVPVSRQALEDRPAAALAYSPELATAEKEPARVRSVAPSDTTGTHPAWSSAQQSVIQVNPDGTAATPADLLSGMKSAISAAGPAVAQQLQKVAGFTAAQIAAGEHKNAAEKTAAMAEAALQAAADRQEVARADQHAADSAAMEQPSSSADQSMDTDTLLKAFKDKAQLQAAARRLDPAMKVNRTRANLANDMVSHPQWAARRTEFVGQVGAEGPHPEAAPAWKPTPEEVTQATPPATNGHQQYPNAGLPSTSPDLGDAPERVAHGHVQQPNPFAQPEPAPADPPSAPKSPEDEMLERIAVAGGKSDLAEIWEHCQQVRIPWSARLQQAAATRMSSF